MIADSGSSLRENADVFDKKNRALTICALPARAEDDVRVVESARTWECWL